MSQIIKKGLTANSVDGTKIRLANNEYIRARNAADNADIDLLKINAADAPEFSVFPQKSGTPAAANDLVNKSYVDGLLSGLKWKAPVLVATTANITLSGEQTIDGILTASSRVLVKAQTLGENNGIYVSGSGAWTRATDADIAAEVEGMAVFVSQGTVNGDKAFTQTADTVTLGTTPLVFVQFSSSASLTSEKQTFVLSGGDITNQYVDLANVAEVDSIDMKVLGLGPMLEGGSYQYTVSYTGGSGGNTRIVFQNEIATGGVSELIALDVMQISYRY